MVHIRPTDFISTEGHAHLRFAVARVVNVHVHDVAARSGVAHDLGPLDDAVGAEVAGGGGPREEGADVGPLHQVGGGVAVDILEGGAERLVLAYQVVGPIGEGDTTAVGLNVVGRVSLPGV